VGVIVDTTNPRSMQMASDAGFTHAKMMIQWARLEPKRGRYTFNESSENDLDNVMKVATGAGLKLVVRVDGAPDWAGAPAKMNTDAVEAFYAAMAAHAKGTIVAYEILNEPNLPFEWGAPPSPSAYTALLKAAYRGVKRGDPSALVIGGGLSPATGGAGGTIEDVDFIRGMYAAGVRGSMDALAVHNYGGNFEPERDPGSCSICFRRAEIYRQVMVENGDSATAVWATEFGWLMDPGRNMGQYDWMRVSADNQADYLVRAFRYARANWPWMGGMLLSNLDASTSPYHTGAQDGLPWFAILNKDHSPRPAWKAFKNWREQDRAEVAKRRAGTAQAAVASNVAAAPAGQVDAPPTVDVPAFPAAIPTSTSQPTSTPNPTATVTPLPTLESGPTETPKPTPAVPQVATVTGMRVQVGLTDGTGVNLRARPRTDAESLGVLADGTQLDVVGEDVQGEGRTWRNVRTARGVTGWVAAQYLSP